MRSSKSIFRTLGPMTSKRKPTHWALA